MIVWHCKQCRHENPDEEDFCDKCFAPRRASGAPRETCRTCLHRHSSGKLCHVYVVDEKIRRRKAKKWSKPRKRRDEISETETGRESDSTSSAEDSTDSDGSSSVIGGTTSAGEEETDEDDEQAEEDETSDLDSTESEGSDADIDSRPAQKKGVMGLGDRLAAKAAAIAKTAGNALQTIAGTQRTQPLEAAPWATESSFKRCNCDHGVPTDSTAFVPLQEGRIIRHDAVGSVVVRTAPLSGDELAFENRPMLAVTPPPRYALRLFLEYMDPRTVASCAHTSTEWHRECYEIDEGGRPLHPTYVGLHLMELESSVDACEDKIDALFYHQPPTGGNGQLFTSGQRSVTVWRRFETEVPPDDTESRASAADGSQTSDCSETSNTFARPTRVEVSWRNVGVALRDTAPFTSIRPINTSIMCCSSNGSIREWSNAHEVKNTRFLAQMWEHNGYITDVVFTAPSLGYCKAHGAPGHSCFMYSVSDDRFLKVWDLSTKECVHTVKPRVSDCGTLQSVTMSNFHLYAGSSNGRVVVFALGRVCQRPEKHRCHLHDEPQWFCEQETFSHGEEPVQRMICGGVGGKYKYLFTASRDGSIMVRNVPKASFGHDKVCTFHHHKRAVTALSITKTNLFSASDEGHVRIWSLGTLSLQRVVKQEWRIKCIWVHHAPPEADNAGSGSLFLGLATGLVLAYPITSSV